MKRALISVSDKSNIVEFAMALVDHGFEIISTGGTYEILKTSGVNAIEISQITKFPEMFNGRVKTLNPFIHGAILYKRKSDEHVLMAKKSGITSIDLVCVNLYPFESTTKKTDNFDEIIENIDIGGPAMIRSAAKNFNDVITVTDISDYPIVINALDEDINNIDFRRNLMIKAYEHTAAYDSFIANYMNSRFNNGFGQKQFIVGSKVFDTSYGENPHQNAALYEFDNYFTKYFKILKGQASFNNLYDLNSAIKIISSFDNQSAVVICKHTNPCGFAIKDNLTQAYIQALKCDPLSAFGGVVAVNGTINEEMAQKMSEIFLEVIVARHITSCAQKIFAKKKRLKLFEYDAKKISLLDDQKNFKHINGGFIYQDSDKITQEEVKNSKLVSTHIASKQEMEDAVIAWKLAGYTKSNSIVYVKNSILVAIGMGMTSRVDAIQCALKKAKAMKIDLNGASVASEAFFPFRDSIDEIAKVGVKTIIQPGGSIRDSEVIQAANEHGIALYFTGVRHFLH